VAAGSDQPLVRAHAVRRPNGDLDVLLVNEDPDSAHPVNIDYTGWTPSGATPTVYSYLNGGTAVTSAATGTATSQTLPPYSLAVLVLHPKTAAAGAPGAPGQPTATAVTGTTATVAWPAAARGSHPIAKYEVYRQNGTTAEELGETAGTSFTVANLDPGSRYTVNVLARDTSGAVSWSSPPLTLTTGTPASSTCAVRLTDTNDWASGYVGSIDITNNGTAALAGWTLAFGWPTRWQSLGSGWNGTWTQTGSTVTVASTPDNGNLGAGATANVGFVGNYNGPNVLPTAFTLNGTVCTTVA
jgi:hypothetical protein